MPPLTISGLAESYLCLIVFVLMARRAGPDFCRPAFRVSTIGAERSVKMVGPNGSGWK
jgi:hypothetical protein